MNLLLPESGLLFWMTIIFVIVFLVLARFGFPMITGMVEKRNRRIDDALDAARKAEEALAELQQEREKILEQTHAEQTRMLQEAAAEREKMMVQAQEQAREQAGKIMDEARVKIQEEKEAALRDIRKEVAVLSVAIAEKLVRKELSTPEGQKELLDRITEEMPQL